MVLLLVVDAGVVAGGVGVGVGVDVVVVGVGVFFGVGVGVGVGSGVHVRVGVGVGLGGGGGVGVGGGDIGVSAGSCFLKLKANEPAEETNTDSANQSAIPLAKERSAIPAANPNFDFFDQ